MFSKDTNSHCFDDIAAEYSDLIYDDISSLKDLQLLLGVDDCQWEGFPLSNWIDHHINYVDKKKGVVSARIEEKNTSLARKPTINWEDLYFKLFSFKRVLGTMNFRKTY